MYPDEDGIHELLDNIPEVAKEFDIISKIGEGEWGNFCFSKFCILYEKELNLAVRPQITIAKILAVQ